MTMMLLNDVRAALIHEFRTAAHSDVYVRCLQELPPISVDPGMWLYVLGGPGSSPRGLIDNATDALSRGGSVQEMRSWLTIYDMLAGLRLQLLETQRAEPVKVDCICEGAGCGSCGHSGVEFEEWRAA
jgi:hypothetical protein